MVAYTFLHIIFLHLFVLIISATSEISTMGLFRIIKIALILLLWFCLPQNCTLIAARLVGENVGEIKDDRFPFSKKTVNIRFLKINFHASAGKKKKISKTSVPICLLKEQNDSFLYHLNLIKNERYFEKVSFCILSFLGPQSSQGDVALKS